ncbi:MAG: hypothetical protein FH749_12220 [Firmicutes bacterium]|nr:hypothetical protein [Bacillota bacterium]
MAQLIPELDPAQIENEGERRVYMAARELPSEYTVFYSYKFTNQITAAVVWEADLIIVHPYLGFLVVEIKKGEMGYFNGAWHAFRGGVYRQLEKDPVQQARNAMYAVAKSYQAQTSQYFPLKFNFVLCFPDCSRVSGELPGYIREHNLLLHRDVDNFPVRIAEIFNTIGERRDSAAARQLVDRVLNRSFRVYNTLEDQIRAFADRLAVHFTDEQQRILEETELNKRMIFYGAAGTGKTMLAVEKARRLAESGKKVLLTCYNKNLARQFPADSPNLTALHFHGLLEQVTGLRKPADIARSNDYFEQELPNAGFDYFSSAPAQQKFDSLVVDEGQDFHPHWIACLEAMLREDGEFYIFADGSQNIFEVDPAGLERLPASRFRLTTNLRNTVSICQNWIEPLSGARLRMGLRDSGEIHFHSWRDDEEQRRVLAQEIGRLVSKGIQPRRITVLSPNRREKSCLADVQKIRDWPLRNVGDPDPNALRFSTVRAFKGLEADIVMLIGVRPDSRVCSRADLYVGGSRARYALHVLHRDDWQPLA